MNGIIIPSAKTVSESKKVTDIVSNRNLLDNPWFTVNQRGQSSYIASGTNPFYTVDRWISANELSKVDVDSNGVTITGLETLSQYYENRYADFQEFKCGGKTVTLSVMLQDGTIFSKSGVFPSVKPVDASNIFITLPLVNGYGIRAVVQTSGSFVVQVFNITSLSTISLRAVKLELGSISTLANDTAPDYTDELMRCRRFLQPLVPNIKDIGIYSGALGGQTTADFTYVMIPQMRATPSIVMNGATVRLIGANIDTGAITFNKNANSITYYTGDNNAVLVVLHFESGITLPTNSRFSIDCSGSSTIPFLSADL